MKFRFRLERLKRVRGIEERIARAALSSAERRARDAEEAVEAQRAIVDLGRADAAGAADGPLSTRSAELDRRAIDHLLRVLTARRESSLTARGQADRQGQAWRAKERERRGLEELESRLKARFRREAERAEAAALDEIALNRTGAAARRREFDSSRPPGPADETGPGSPRHPR
jgi:flagellar export protein FliJ